MLIEDVNRITMMIIMTMVSSSSTSSSSSSRSITSTTSYCTPNMPTFLSDGAEFILQFDVVAGALNAVRQTGHGGLEVHQLGTQVGIGGVQTDGGHAGRQRHLEGGKHGRNTKKREELASKDVWGPSTVLAMNLPRNLERNK